MSIKAQIEKLGPIGPNNVLVFHQVDNEGVMAMALEVLRSLEHPPLVVVLNQDQSLELLDEELMRAHGWVRQEGLDVALDEAQESDT